MATTMENLAAAFAGESQANRKYLAFAKKADADGMTQVAKVFRAAAEAETVHAHAHFRAMGGVKSTVENLEEAVAGEAYEVEEMYPPMLATAQEEGIKQAEISFKYALAVEKVHRALYEKALDSVKDGRDLAPAKIYVCPVCGNTVEGQAPEACDVCNVPGSKFMEIA